MINKYFNNVFCINLARRSDRRIQIEREFSIHDIKSEFVDAIDGKTINPMGIISADGSLVSSGDIGCTQSHLKVVKIAKERNLPFYVVFEDDAEFNKDFNKLYNKYITQIPDYWDAIYFGGNHCIPPMMVSENIGRIMMSYTTHAMIIKNTVYDALIEGWSKIEKVDITISQLQNKFNFFVTKPHLVYQRDGFSDILERQTSYPFLK